jgi:outer membrane protein assembly factor BamB
VNIHGWYTALVRTGTHLWGVSPDTCRPYCDSASHTGFYASAIEFNASDGSYVRAVSRSNIQTPVALAADGAHVWMVGSDVNGNGAAGTVIELDASNGRQLWSTAITVYNNPQATTYDSITYAGGFLWVANGESVRVLSGAQYQLNGPAVVVAAGHNVFVLNTNGNSVTEIDARTGALEHILSAARYHFNGRLA